jgi:hypothetical protein
MESGLMVGNGYLRRRSSSKHGFSVFVLTKEIICVSKKQYLALAAFSVFV